MFYCGLILHVHLLQLVSVYYGPYSSEQIPNFCILYMFYIIIDQFIIMVYYN